MGQHSTVWYGMVWYGTCGVWWPVRTKTDSVLRYSPVHLPALRAAAAYVGCLTTAELPQVLAAFVHK